MASYRERPRSKGSLSCKPGSPWLDPSTVQLMLLVLLEVIRVFGGPWVT
jgi:hypothetical protein